MPERNQKAGKAIAAAFAVVMVMPVTLSVAPLPLGGQDTRSVITVIYGNGAKLLVRDWNFVYVFMDDENVYPVCMVSDEGSWCPTKVKTSTDLHLVKPSTGPNTWLQELVIFRKEDLKAIRIRWKSNNLGPYASDGVTLNRNRSAPRYESEEITVVTTQGAEHTFTESLQVPKAFLSDKKYFYFMSILLSGRVRSPVLPDYFEQRLDGKFTASSPKERIEEIRFRQD